MFIVWRVAARHLAPQSCEVVEIVQMSKCDIDGIACSKF